MNGQDWNNDKLMVRIREGTVPPKQIGSTVEWPIYIYIYIKKVKNIKKKKKKLLLNIICLECNKLNPIISKLTN